jgi:hypothetical protein
MATVVLGVLSPVRVKQAEAEVQNPYIESPRERERERFPED